MICYNFLILGGFTLIELIVVIAILGILAAIAVPRFTNVTENAQTQADEATARTIASAVTMATAGTTDGAQPGKADIEEFLNDVTVTVRTDGAGQADAGWVVSFDDADSSAFKVFLNTDQKYPKP